MFLLQSNASTPDYNDRAINGWECLNTLIITQHGYETFRVLEIHQLTQNHLGEVGNIVVSHLIYRFVDLAKIVQSHQIKITTM